MPVISFQDEECGYTSSKADAMSQCKKGYRRRHLSDTEMPALQMNTLSTKLDTPGAIFEIGQLTTQPIAADN
jgi:hypothetical protein